LDNMPGSTTCSCLARRHANVKMKAVRCSGSIAARLNISTATGREYALEAAMTPTVHPGRGMFRL
jgi:hypothetical protein